ncbi:hypothetical protein VMCG_00283 [Cytospora schulzeri]|uniref:Uncharacterized protein n=1 Tax=Cytospora schulzeri TaxID=448051 RepID=A0A423X8L6_9PEZI|nr:hypothetical protein VMCG_00283 [Valsa malicola]
MAPRTDPYTIRTKNLHQRYGLSKNFMQLLASLQDHRRGIGDPDALGRWMRMSHQMRKTCTDTISCLAESMQKNPTPDCVAECTSLISSCTELLKFANEPKKETSFPFMRLPAEIRQRVYKFYFLNLFTSDEPGKSVIICNTRTGCLCPPHESFRTKSAFPIKMHLCFVSGDIKDELLAQWYKTQRFHFACCCELNERLRTSASLRQNLKTLIIHWTGPKSDEAFKLLKQVTTLRSLTIEVSKSTTNCVSKREASVTVYFRSKPARLCDALGYDELVSLRGLEEVGVEHVQGRQALRRTHEERMCLENALMDHVKARPEGQN